MPKIQLPERKTMKPFSAFAGIGASIFVPSALTSRSEKKGSEPIDIVFLLDHPVLSHVGSYQKLGYCINFSRVERSAPCCRVRPLGLRLPSKRTSPFFGGYPSSNRTCRFPAYGSPCGTGFISFAPLRPSAPFHIDSNGCSSIWTSGFRRAAT